MSIPKLNIGGLIPKFPVIQGGMGVGISRSSLAGSVAACGGIGVLSGVQIGFEHPDFTKNTLKCNLEELENQIKKARAKAPHGILGVNLMVAMKNYVELAQKAVSCKIDLIISGAGLPLDLPAIIKGTATRIAPIVSSAKAANIICRMWDKKYQYAPDCIIVEGPLAGGHLGFSMDDIEKSPDVLDIVKEVKKVASEYSIKYSKIIPVVAAGGIYTGEDVALALKSGADGVQMGTRFVTTHECDAHPNYKEAYINCKEEDIGIIMSPVGMPGRAIHNKFLRSSKDNSSCLYKCISKCKVVGIPFCISKALINAVNGNVDNSLLFCGSKAYMAKKIEAVKDIFDEITLALKTV